MDSALKGKDNLLSANFVTTDYHDVIIVRACTAYEGRAMKIVSIYQREYRALVSGVGG